MIKSTRAWLTLSLIWMAAVAYVCWLHWPQLPLDVSTNDPKTLDLYGVAMLNHTAFYSLLGLFGPMVLLVMLRVGQRTRKD